MKQEETSVEVSILYSRLHSSSARLWSRQDSVSSKLASGLVVNAELLLIAL